MKIDRSHLLVTRRGMLLGEVVGKIYNSGGPIDMELALLDSM
jgi:hypothetical protein